MEKGIFRPWRSSDAERSDRTAGDRMRHRQKVREAIKENIADIISEESIIGKSRDRIIKVPIRGIKEYRFVYGDNTPGVAQGDGNVGKGQVVGRRDGQGKQDQDRAGDQPGVDYYETDITLGELIDIMFEDLMLPDMERKKLKMIQTIKKNKRKGYRRKGIEVRRDKRRTQIEKLKRKIKQGIAVYPRDATVEEWMEFPPNIQEYYKLEKDGIYHQRFPFHKDDERFKHLEEDIEEESNAVVFCIMDTSGSMDTAKKYLARSFFFLLCSFVMRRYMNVEIVFISHHTEAQEVDEEQFFHKGESGGTFISSGYAKALEIISERYHPSLWNIYAFHCSDGDNFSEDNERAMQLAKKLIDVSNLFGYAEVKPDNTARYESSMLSAYKRFESEKHFDAVLIQNKKDVWKKFKELISHDKGGEE